jgi:hypothetical protein
MFLDDRGTGSTEKTSGAPVIRRLRPEAWVHLRRAPDPSRRRAARTQPALLKQPTTSAVPFLHPWAHLTTLPGALTAIAASAALTALISAPDLIWPDQDLGPADWQVTTVIAMTVGLTAMFCALLNLVAVAGGCWDSWDHHSSHAAAGPSASATAPRAGRTG